MTRNLCTGLLATAFAMLMSTSTPANAQPDPATCTVDSLGSFTYELERASVNSFYKYIYSCEWTSDGAQWLFYDTQYCYGNNTTNCYSL